MKDKISGLIVGVSILVELGCVLTLAGISLKRNRDCYEAECKLIGREADLGLATLDIACKESEIAKLKDELNNLKGES